MARKMTLTEDQIKEVKRLYSIGVTKGRIAEDFKLCRQTIYRYLKENAENAEKKEAS